MPFIVKYRHNLFRALLFAVLTVAAILSFARFPRNLEVLSIMPQHGIYDISKDSANSVAYLRLMPDIVYYPNAYVKPEAADDTIPTPVSQMDEIHADYLSQRFILLTSDNAQTYKMTFKLSGRHAMRVFVNGKQVAMTGHLGTTKQETEIWENNILFYATPIDGKMDIILHSAQFYHSKRNATLAELRVEKRTVTATEIESFKGFMVMGALISAVISLLGIYWFQMRNKTTLYFALACSAMAVRECIQSQAWTYFPISGTLSFMLKYLSMVILAIFLCLYLKPYAVSRFLKIMLYTVIGSSIIFGMCVLFTDSLFYTSILKYYQFILLICILFGIGGLLWRMRAPNPEEAVSLYGIAVFYLSAIADLVMYLELLEKPHKNLPISEVAMLIFAITQVFSLYIMNHRVLTQAKLAEQKVALEKESLLKIDQMKTQFLGNISHELKTPLAIISGYAQNTQRQLSTSAPDIVNAVGKMEIISSEAKRLGLLVGQILDITCIEENRMQMEMAACSVDELIATVIATYFPVLNKNNNRLELHLEDALPDVYADRIRITQVMVNLISNAVRFTVNGTILVEATKDHDHVTIQVKDNGDGIPQDMLAHIFDRYVTKAKANSSHAGTGLGLYICHHIVMAHSGSITVESVEGKGTTVRFTLPLASA